MSITTGRSDDEARAARLTAGASTLSERQRQTLLRFSRRMQFLTDAQIGEREREDWMQKGRDQVCTVCLSAARAHSLEQIGRCLRIWILHVVHGPAPSAKPPGKALAPATAVERAEREAQGRLARERAVAQKAWADAQEKAKRPAATRRPEDFDPYRITGEPMKPQPKRRPSPYEVKEEKPSGH